MKRSTSLAAILALAAALLAGCKKDIQNNDAVRQGIMNYLSKRSDLLAMDVKVTSVAFRQDEATATVRFQAKNNSSPNAGMTMEYVLERKGSEWVVKGRAGGEAHSGMPQGAPPSAPPGAPGATGSGSIGAMPQTLPPGHPSVGSGSPSGSLPAGHPAIGTDKK